MDISRESNLGGIFERGEQKMLGFQDVKHFDLGCMESYDSTNFADLPGIHVDDSFTRLVGSRMTTTMLPAVPLSLGNVSHRMTFQEAKSSLPNGHGLFEDAELVACLRRLVSLQARYGDGGYKEGNLTIGSQNIFLLSGRAVSAMTYPCCRNFIIRAWEVRDEDRIRAGTRWFFPMP